jgi:hypothetical protein
MAKSPKANSFRRHIVEQIEKIEGYENLNTLLKPEQSKADHSIYNRAVIIEQKEHRSSPEHNVKGMALEAFCKTMIEKYNLDFHSPPLTEEEAAEFRNLKGKFSKKIKDNVHNANKIAATKEYLVL